MRRFFLLLPLLGFAVSLGPALSLAGDPKSSAPKKRDRKPAPVMSYQGAGWLERLSREREENPQKLIAALKLEPGDVVADIGCGSGYYARRMAPMVGPSGKVYGVDIQPEMLQIMKQLMKRDGVTNIEAVLGEPTDPKLPPGSVDWMLLVDVYHEFQDPAPMLAKMREALKDDGKVALVEFRLEGATARHIKIDHRMSPAQVMAEWEPAGYTLLELNEDLPTQHLFIFGKTPAKSSDASADTEVTPASHPVEKREG